MYIILGGAADFFSGSTEDDIIDGGIGGDTISGLEGSDRLYGGADFFSDNLIGGAGNDFLFGEQGDDFLTGGTGADLLDGSLGFDTVGYQDATSGVVVDLASGGSGGDALGDVFVSIEAVIGSNHNDIITGNAFATTFQDTFGSDRYIGRAAGGDTYEAFNEVIVAETRFVEIAFGSRAAQLAAQGGVALPTGAGIAVRERTDGVFEYDVLVGIDNFVGSTGYDLITGNGGANVISGGDGNDTLNGEGGFDFVAYGEGFTPATVDLATGIGSQGGYDDQLSGFEGVIGSFQNDTIRGAGNAERLQGEGGNDVVNGFGGNDHLLGGSGTDLLFGDAGNDILEGGEQGDLFDGGSGSDRVSYLNSEGGVYVDLLERTGLQLVGHPSGHSLGDRYISIEQITGSKHEDYVQGDNLANTIEGLDGDDEIDGCGGNDVIYGDYSPNHNPGFAAPVLASGSHADEECMDCDDGHEGGEVVVLSGPGLNEPASADWNDEINGGDGDDRLFGQAGSDLLLGDCDNDTLFGGAQVDALFGGEDDDVLEGGESFDVLFGGSGLDIASYASSAGAVNVSLAAFWNNTGGDAVSSLITELIGLVSLDDDVNSIFDNAIFAGLLAQLNDEAFQLANLFQIPDIYFGIEGLRGSRFNDVLTGTGAANVLEGGAGNDRLNGGSGSDTASYASAGGGVTVSLLSGVSSGSAGSDTLVAMENLTGGAFNDVLTGDNSANNLDGGAGNDTINGSAGNDKVDGGSGNDTINGGVGNDAVNGGSGNDTINGQDGNDTLEGGAGADTLNGGAGIDTASYAGATASVTVRLFLAATQNTGGAGSDRLISMENLTGGAAGDSLTGSASANAISGGTGNDLIAGGGGNDILLGGSGNDILRGEAGADRLTGGLNADRFDFDAVGQSGLTAATRDIITDFVRAQGDRIDLSTIDANSGAGGNQAFQFIGAAAFSGNAAGKLRYDAANDRVLGSTDADTAAEFSIQVNGLNSMVAADFVL